MQYRINETIDNTVPGIICSTQTNNHIIMICQESKLLCPTEAIVACLPATRYPIWIPPPNFFRHYPELFSYCPTNELGGGFASMPYPLSATLWRRKSVRFSNENDRTYDVAFLWDSSPSPKVIYKSYKLQQSKVTAKLKLQLSKVINYSNFKKKINFLFRKIRYLGGK